MAFYLVLLMGFRCLLLPCVVILVLLLETTLIFSDHISDIVVRAHRRANLIHRCFVSGNVTLLIRAFLTYVRHLVEYSVVLSAYRKGDILVTGIENVQRRPTKT